MNTKVTIAGVEWNNPVTVASGTFGSGAEFTDFVDLNRLGAVTTKGVANVPWTGNPTPRVAETYGRKSQNCRCSFYRKRGYSLSARVNHLRFEGTFRLLEARKCAVEGQR